VLGVYPIITELDQFIAAHAPEWPLDQVAIVDRNILRMALWEFAVSEKVPIKVAINEAVELAKVYGSDSAPRFVNGVLGSLAEKQNEIRQALQKLKK
jgi:N utilization substance protein B